MNAPLSLSVDVYGSFRCQRPCVWTCCFETLLPPTTARQRCSNRKDNFLTTTAAAVREQITLHTLKAHRCLVFVTVSRADRPEVCRILTGQNRNFLDTVLSGRPLRPKHNPRKWRSFARRNFSERHHRYDPFRLRVTKGRFAWFHRSCQSTSSRPRSRSPASRCGHCRIGELGNETVAKNSVELLCSSCGRRLLVGVR